MPQGRPDPRLVNRLGALSLHVTDAMRAAVGDRVDDFALVALLNFADGESVASLQRALELSQPGSAHLVGRLEAAGAVERRRDPADGRVVTVHLTRAGRARAERLVASRMAALETLVGALPARDQEALLALLDPLLEAATSSHESARRICRLCSVDGCDHPATCPVTRAAAAT